MIFLFGMWIDLILYKLFIGFDIAPTSVCIIEIQDWMHFKAMLFCYFCTCRVEILSFVDYKQNQFMHYRDCHRVEPKWKYLLGKDWLQSPILNSWDDSRAIGESWRKLFWMFCPVLLVRCACARNREAEINYWQLYIPLHY